MKNNINNLEKLKIKIKSNNVKESIDKKINSLKNLQIVVKNI